MNWLRSKLSRLVGSVGVLEEMMDFSVLLLVVLPVDFQIEFDREAVESLLEKKY